MSCPPRSVCLFNLEKSDQYFFPKKLQNAPLIEPVEVKAS